MSAESGPGKTTYEPPVLVKLGSLEELTKDSFENSWWHWPKPWHPHHPNPPDCYS
jgi:hypothetical protein